MSICEDALATTGELFVTQLGEEQCESLHSFGPAVRNGYLIHYVVSGRGEYLAHGKRHTLSAGQGFLILPGEIITYQADEKQPWHYLWIGYQGASAPELTLKAGFSGENLVFSLPEIERASALIRSAEEEVRSLRMGEMSALGSLLKLMALIAQYNAPQDEAVYSSMAQAYFRKAAWFIEGRLSQQVSVTDVASYVGLCRSQLFRVFRETAQMSPQEWIQRARLQQAQKLLRSRPTLSLNEAAMSAGYSSAAQMTAAFRRFLQTTPGAYRKAR